MVSVMGETEPLACINNNGGSPNTMCTITDVKAFCPRWINGFLSVLSQLTGLALFSVVLTLRPHNNVVSARQTPPYIEYNDIYASALKPRN